jgi:GNAT superfamily N-acetyltransferase
VNWTVRRAVAGDAEQLSAFGSRVYGATFAADNDPAQLALYLATAYTPAAQASELADPDLTTLLVCDGADAIAAFAQLRMGPVPSCVADAAAIELWRFYVDQVWHGRGVAALLMDAVLGEAGDPARACSTVWLGVWERNARAQAFYRKCGFAPVGTHVFMFGTEPQTDEIWARRL